MNRRQKIIVSVTGIFLVLLILVGLTYAFFVTRIRGNNNPTSISVTTANLVVEYTDGDSNGDGRADAYMAFEKIQPSDTVTYTKVFNVENKGNDTASYSVILDEMTNEFERNQDLQYTLTRSGETDPVASGYLVVGTHQIILGKVDIDVEEIHTYTLTIKYDEAGIDQSVDMNKTLSFKVDIDNERVTWDNATEGTLLYAIKNNKTDATMGSTEDDYGTSYYYKGAVTNNFVNYSGMCWRIVRVQGDGTVKLTLADSENECNEEGYSSTWNYEDDSAIISSIDSYFDPYPTPSSTNISEIVNTYSYENSSLKTSLDSWANTINTNLLVKTDFCNDTSLFEIFNSEFIPKEDAYFPPEYPPENGVSDWYVYEYNFSVANRYKNNTPTLKCNMTGLENTKATRVESNIAMLTIDEILFAGAKESTACKPLESFENCYYLLTDTGAMAWHDSITPHSITISINDNNYLGDVRATYYYGVIDNDFTYYILNNQTTTTDSVVLTRPVISITSNALLDKNITGQNGTEDNPYDLG